MAYFRFALKESVSTYTVMYFDLFQFGF